MPNYLKRFDLQVFDSCERLRCRHKVTGLVASGDAREVSLLQGMLVQRTE